MLFKFLVYFFVGLLIFRFISSLFRPRRTSGQYSTHQRTTNGSKRREGEVSVNVNQNTQKKHIPKDEGDYVDYEEV